MDPVTLRQARRLKRALNEAVDVPADPAFVRRVTIRALEQQPKRPLLWVAPLVAAGLALFTLAPPPSTFTARGARPSAESRLGLEVFRHAAGPSGRRAPIEADAEIGPADGLSFVVYNRSGERVFVSILLIDAHGERTALYQNFPVPPRPEVVPLPDGFTLEPERLQLVALFSRAPLALDASLAQLRTAARHHRTLQLRPRRSP